METETKVVKTVVLTLSESEATEVVEILELADDSRSTRYVQALLTALKKRK